MRKEEAVTLLERLLMSNRFDKPKDFAITAVDYLEQRGVHFESRPTSNEIAERNQAIMEYLERKEKL